MIVGDWDRLLDNWARWLLQRGGGGCSISGCYQLALSGPRARSDGGIPVTQAEAEDTDTLIGLLTERALADALVVMYCWSGSVSVKARQHGCSERALYDRVARAKVRLSELRRGRSIGPRAAR